MTTKKLTTHMKTAQIYSWLIGYAAVAWVLLQVAEIVINSFGGDLYLMQLLILAVVAAAPMVFLVLYMLRARLAGMGDKIDAARAPAVADVTAGHSIVVLPLECFSDQALDQWYCDAIAEELSSLISRQKDFRVVSRHSAKALAGSGMDSVAIVRELGVSYWLQGSLRRTGSGLRVAAQLVDSASGAQLWSQRYDRASEDFESLLDDLCQAMASQLGVELTRAEISCALKRAPSEWGVWELYQQAKGTLQFSGWSSQTFADTEKLLREAIEIDPEFAPARAYLALILALARWTSFHRDGDCAYASAMEQIDTAVALSPDSSEVLGFAGCALSDLGHPQRGIPLLTRAIALNPSNAQAHAALGAANLFSGNSAFGMEQLEYAVRLSPADPGLAPWATVLSVACSCSGRVEEGRAWADKAVQSDPRYFGAQLALALVYAHLDEPGKAQRSLSEALRLSPELTQDTVRKLMGAQNFERLLGAELSFARKA